MDAHVGPARRRPCRRCVHHSGAERRPSQAVSSVGRERGGAGVAGRERRRQRLAHRVARVALDRRARAPEQPLEALVDDEALDAEGAASTGTWPARRSLVSPRRDVDEVPDQAEVAERDAAERSTDRRPACPRSRSSAPIGPPVEAGDRRAERAAPRRAAAATARASAGAGSSDSDGGHTPAVATSSAFQRQRRLDRGECGVAAEARAPTLEAARSAQRTRAGAGSRRCRRPARPPATRRWCAW